MEYAVGTLFLGVFFISENVIRCDCVFFGLNRLDFHHMRLNLLLKFVKNCLSSSNVIIQFFGRLFILGKEFKHDCNIIGLNPKSVANLSFYAVRCAVSEHFAASNN